MTFAYAPRMRIWGTAIDGYEENVPKTTIKLGATNKEDVFMVNNEKGNGALTYPVGLITSDEVVMAGGRGWINEENPGTNSNYYLYSGSWYWTFSPNSFSIASFMSVIRVGDNGFIGFTHVSSAGGVRPVISLPTRVLYINGNGTGETPYIITK